MLNDINKIICFIKDSNMNNESFKNRISKEQEHLTSVKKGIMEHIIENNGKCDYVYCDKCLLNPEMCLHTKDREKESLARKMYLEMVCNQVTDNTKINALMWLVYIETSEFIKFINTEYSIKTLKKVIENKGSCDCAECEWCPFGDSCPRAEFGKVVKNEELLIVFEYVYKNLKGDDLIMDFSKIGKLAEIEVGHVVGNKKMGFKEVNTFGSCLYCYSKEDRSATLDGLHISDILFLKVNGSDLIPPKKMIIKENNNVEEWIKCKLKLEENVIRMQLNMISDETFKLREAEIIKKISDEKLSGEITYELETEDVK